MELVPPAREPGTLELVGLIGLESNFTECLSWKDPERQVSSSHVSGEKTDPGRGRELLRASQLFRGTACA